MNHSSRFKTSYLTII